MLTVSKWHGSALVSDEEIAEGTKRFQKKARFLIDEDIHSETAPFLKGKGWNVITASDAGLVGHSDSDYVALARKEDRLLLTHDRHYLSDRKFPLGSNGGVLVLPGSSGNIRELVLGLIDMLSIIAPYWNAYRGSKIEVHGDRTISIRSRQRSGEVMTSRYRLRPNAMPEIWERVEL